jgi:hypothetical protein
VRPLDGSLLLNVMMMNAVLWPYPANGGNATLVIGIKIRLQGKIGVRIPHFLENGGQRRS